MIFVSTSRKPSQETRRLARWLALLAGGETENRGKRSVGEVAARAAVRGFSRVLFIYEKHGTPRELVFFDEDKGWLEPGIILSGVVFPDKEREKEAGKGGKRPRLPGAARVVAVDAAGEKIKGLFGIGEKGKEGVEEDSGDFVEIRVGEKEISFQYCGKQVGPRLKTTVAVGGGGKET